MLNVDSFEDDEKRLLDPLAESLRRDFPNPTRIGCPDSAILKDLALRRLAYAELQRWLPHLSTCGECFSQCESLRRDTGRKHRRASFLVAATAAVLVIAMIAGWLLLRDGNQAATEVLDLRHVAPLSEVPDIQTAQVLVLHRSTRHIIVKQIKQFENITIEQIAVFSDDGTNLFDTTVTPQVQDQMLLFRIDLELQRFDPGYYRLAVRRPGLAWSEYRLNLR